MSLQDGKYMERIRSGFSVPSFYKKQRNKEKSVFSIMPKTPDSIGFTGAGERIRTAGFLITSEIL